MLHFAGRRAISIHALREEGDDLWITCLPPFHRFLSTPSARRATCRGLPGRLLQPDFYPRPPRGGRPSTSEYKTETKGISIHALREEGDARRLARQGAAADFYPRPPRGGRLQRLVRLDGLRRISIHALREEGDSAGEYTHLPAFLFLSTPSARRATRKSLPRKKAVIRFLSTPSARRATVSWRMPRAYRTISIHALREEGDNDCTAQAVPDARFLSTPSARRATIDAFGFSCRDVISIHALREEGDGLPSHAFSLLLVFLSTPSARRATSARARNDNPDDRFLSTPSARRATPALTLVLFVSFYFYPRPPRGGRRRHWQHIKTDAGFLSTPSARRATTAFHPLRP